MLLSVFSTPSNLIYLLQDTFHTVTTANNASSLSKLTPSIYMKFIKSIYHIIKTIKYLSEC